jgi:hypothetical protein
VRRIQFLLATVGVTLALLGCEPVKSPPVPNRVALAGDSILWQSYLYGGDLRGADVDHKVYPGWRWEHAQPRVTQDVAGAGTSPDVLVVAFGQNSAGNYDANQSAALMAMVFSPHPDACVVLVQPHPRGDATDPAIHAMRNDMRTLEGARPNTYVVDWSNKVLEHPEWLGSDMIHLNVPTYEQWVASGAVPEPAAVGYLEMIWEGTENCV